jgi:hypothetical protein
MFGNLWLSPLWKSLSGAAVNIFQPPSLKVGGHIARSTSEPQGRFWQKRRKTPNAAQRAFAPSSGHMRLACDLTPLIYGRFEAATHPAKR